MAVPRPGSPPKRPPPPLDAARLNDLALAYAARFATSEAKLRTYLLRKLRERGWDGEGQANVDAIVARLADLRYVDDAAFATMKGGALTRRGYGARRVDQALRAAGIDEEDRDTARDTAVSARWAAAAAFARRKRIGPYAQDMAEPAQREKHLAAFIRAGHDFAAARAWVHAAPGEEPEEPE